MQYHRSDHPVVFTDGSKSEEECGSSFYAENLKIARSFALPSISTVFPIKLFAIYVGSIFITPTRWSSRRILHITSIYTFSSIQKINLVIKVSISTTTLLHLWIPGAGAPRHRQKWKIIPAGRTSARKPTCCNIPACIGLSPTEAQNLLTRVCIQKFQSFIESTRAGKGYKKPVVPPSVQNFNQTRLFNSSAH